MLVILIVLDGAVVWMNFVILQNNIDNIYLFNIVFGLPLLISSFYWISKYLRTKERESKFRDLFFLFLQSVVSAVWLYIGILTALGAE